MRWECGLVVVRFVDGSERWGTIKNVRYAKKEVKRDGEFKYTMGFSGWYNEVVQERKQTDFFEPYVFDIR